MLFDIVILEKGNAGGGGCGPGFDPGQATLTVMRFLEL
jgi:hypothetical protein